MTNALQLNTSTVVGGLGTQSYTVTTAGLYTLSFKTFIPYFPAGTPAPSANAVAEVQTITTVADVSGSLNSTYWTFYTANNAIGYYVWYNINSAGVDPAPAGLTGIQVTGATNATASTLGGNTRTAIAASAAASYVTVSGSTTGVILTNKQVGQCTAAADGTATTGFTFAVGTAGTFGTPAQSGVVITLKQNSTVLGVYSFPSPTQPIIGGYTTINASANDVISFVATSLSAADNALNAVKSIVNLFQGQGQ